MKKVIWSIVLSWVCLAFAAAGIGTRDAVSACDGKVYKPVGGIKPVHT